MNKSVIASIVTLLAMAIPAQADVFFKGVYIVTEASNCPNGPFVDNRDNAIFHPKAITGNENYSSLNIISTFGADGRTLPGQSFTSTFKGTVSQGIGWSDFIPEADTFIRITSQIPATLSATSQSVILQGQIQNPWGELGQENCIVTFNYSGVRN